jgi:hypothetical protein
MFKPKKIEEQYVYIKNRKVLNPNSAIPSQNIQFHKISSIKNTIQRFNSVTKHPTSQNMFYKKTQFKGLIM